MIWCIGVCDHQSVPVVRGGDIGDAQGGHTVDPRPPFPRHGVGWGGAGWGMGLVGLAVAAAARGGHPLRLGVSDKVPGGERPFAGGAG